jgi:phytoene dehydrogenase-like protein
MAQAGYKVSVFESDTIPGGGCTTRPLTLPGFLHDHCSAIHPLGLGSPFFRTLPLSDYGLTWINPEIAVAHPLDNGKAILLKRSIAATAYDLGKDSNSYSRLFGAITPSEGEWRQACEILRRPILLSMYPVILAKFGLNAVLSAEELVSRYFSDTPARALMAGIAAHSFLPLDQKPSATFALTLGVLGHTIGWPLPQGGSQEITNSLIAHLQSLGGEVIIEKRILSLDEFPENDLIMADINAAQLPGICGTILESSYADNLTRFKPGPGLFKLDYALDSPVPWAAKECLNTATVHLGGTFEEIAESEAAICRGEHPDKPFVLCAQQSLFDSTRAPDGKHTFWAYCHVPKGSTVDMTSQIENQIERFAPGFRERILARTATYCADFERINPSIIGGDISGGAYYLTQIITRPTLSLNPWQVPLTNNRKMYICSSSTPPGGGVHGMCGYYAAQSALGELWK